MCCTEIIYLLKIESKFISKCSLTTFININIRHRMASPRMLYSVTLMQIFKAKHLEYKTISIFSSSNTNFLPQGQHLNYYINLRKKIHYDVFTDITHFWSRDVYGPGTAIWNRRLPEWNKSFTYEVVFIRLFSHSYTIIAIRTNMLLLVESFRVYYSKLNN